MRFAASYYDATNSESFVDIQQETARFLTENRQAIALVDTKTYAGLKTDSVPLGEIRAFLREDASGFSAGAAPETDCIMLHADTYRNRAAILVDPALYAAFGRELLTWDDYVEFLYFAAAEAPERIPGRIPTDEYFRDNPFMELYMLQQGFRVEHYAGAAALCFDESFRLHAVETLDAFHDMNREILTLREEGLIKLSNGGSWSYTGPDFSSALVQLSDYLGSHYDGIFARGFNASQYELVIPYLHWGLVLEDNGAEQRVVMAADCNPAELIRFLERMSTDAALYQSIMLGEAETDYILDAQVRYKPRTRDGVAYTRSAVLLGFISIAMDEGLPLPAHAPQKLYEAYNGITDMPDADYALYRERLTAYLRTQGGAPARDDTYYARSRAVYTYYEQLYMGDAAVALPEYGEDWPKPDELLAAVNG